MMSQQRVRKPVGVGDTVTRSSVVKAAGDTVPCSRPNNNERGRSKTKIPKSIRYDLETALVGLCDVWFEEIKPHLIRNNIKLHVDGMGCGSGPAGGDQGPPVAQPDAQANGCDHLDPGAASDRRRPWIANFAGCCSTRRTASKAPSHKPPVMSPSTYLQALTTRNLISSNKKRRGRSIKHKPSSDPASLASPSYRTVRACRTYSVLRDTTAPDPAVAVAHAPAPSPPTAPRDLPRCTIAKRSRVRSADSNNGEPQQQEATKIHRNNKELKKPRRKAKKFSKFTQTDLPYPPSVPSPPVTKRNSSIQCDRCPANTAINKKIKDNQQISDTSRLYDSKLIELIAELEDKRLRLLYESPLKNEYPSAMNLLPIPYAIPTMRRRRARKLKHPPWK